MCVRACVYVWLFIMIVFSAFPTQKQILIQWYEAEWESIYTAKRTVLSASVSGSVNTP